VIPSVANCEICFSGLCGHGIEDWGGRVRHPSHFHPGGCGCGQGIWYVCLIPRISVLDSSTLYVNTYAEQTVHAVQLSLFPGPRVIDIL
jgi:hypothetical protein